MPRITLTLAPQPDAKLVAPLGLSTPHGTAILVNDPVATHPCDSGNSLAELDIGEGPITVSYDVTDQTAAYPDAMFDKRDSRFTRAADGLIEDAKALANGGDPTKAIADHVAGLFSYGHPDTRYYEDQDELPQLCGMTEGSCVDINAYFIASLRSAGITAGYITGYFFPLEKVDDSGAAWCNDMHCWVVTRDVFGIREWDIAHHLKMGTRDIGAALDPKPGFRVAIAHSMGLSFPGLNLTDLKLIGEPMWAVDGRLDRANPDIRYTPHRVPEPAQ